MSVRHRITSDSALYLASELIEAAANAPSTDYAAYGSFEDTLALVDATGAAIVPLPGYVATLRPGEGRFGGAVAVEEGTTNLHPNPLMNVDSNSDGIVDGFFSDIYSCSPSRSLDGGQKITMGVATVSNAYAGVMTSTYIPVSAGATYTLSVEAKLVRSAAETVELVLVWFDTNNAIISAPGLYNQNPGVDYKRLSLTVTAPANAAKAKVTLRIRASSTSDTGSAWFRRVQLEAKPFATSFVDGTRAEGILRYSDVLSPLSSEGTVSFKWRSPAIIRRGSTQHDFPKVAQMGRYFSNGSLTLWLWDSHLHFMLYNNGWTSRANLIPSVEPERWYDIAITWKNKVFRAFVDGERVHETNQPDLPNEWAHGGDFIIERDSSAHPNALYDELLILPYAASEEEVRSLYQTTVARFHANGDASIKGELVEDDTDLRYGSDGNLYVNELVEGVNF